MHEREMVMFLPDGRYEYLRINTYTEEGKTKLDYGKAYKRILTKEEKQYYKLYNKFPESVMGV